VSVGGWDKKVKDKEYLLKGKDQYYIPPYTNYIRLAIFIELFFFFTK